VVEVADIFRHRGPAWRASHAGHVSLGQLKVMSAIERCRTVALGGHVERCEACAHLRISYNSCRNRHCPKCQAAAAKDWLADRQAELLPVPYFHVVFTLPGPVADIAYQNKAVVYDLLLKTAADTLITIAADPKHLGARIGLTAVLHTWGSALTHHPHAHIIVPGGGFSPKPAPAQAGGQHWIACRPRFLLAVPVLSRLFRRLFLERLTAAYQPGACSSSPTKPHSPSQQRLKVTSPHCARSSGWSMPSGLLADPRLCWLTCLATRTGSLLPTAGWSPSTASV
jgi:hypothetical protein